MTRRVKCPEHRGQALPCEKCVKQLDEYNANSPVIERVKALKWILTGYYGDFPPAWKKVDELVGRPTYTHEMADVQSLIHEVMTGERPSHDDILAKMIKLSDDKPVFTLNADTGAVEQINPNAAMDDKAEEVMKLIQEKAGDLQMKGGQ